MCLCGNCKLNGSKLHYKCEMDIRILTLRALYFFQTTAASSISRFLIVFLNKYFSAKQLGILMGVRKGVSFLSSFIWGFIGDCTQRHLICLIFGLIVSTIILNGLLFDIIGNNFYYSLAVINAATFFGASGCLFDCIVLLILGENEDKKNKNNENEKESDTKEYGATRFWGAAGWGLGALICGTLLAQFGENMLFYFYDATYSIPIFIMIASSSYLTLKQNDGKKGKNEQVEKKKKHKLNTQLFRQNVFTLHGVIFLLNLLIFGCCMAFVEQYLFLFLLDYFGATTTLCGMTICVMVIGELPVFYWSKYWINKFGIIGLLTLAHLAYIIRCVGYTLLPQTKFFSWFILLIEPLHGLTFGGMWIASVEFGSKLAPKSMQGTMQGLIAGIYQGLASCAGTIVGGLLFEYYGPVFMYRLSAAIITGWMIFFQVSLRIIRMCNRDCDAIKIMFGEEETKRQQMNLKKSMAEAPSTSLLINEEIPIHREIK